MTAIDRRTIAGSVGHRGNVRYLSQELGDVTGTLCDDAPELGQVASYRINDLGSLTD